ncbi:MAG TPA: serine hydrolase domain-containing protein [Gemmatimonadales bacterium]|nr:serine hydrolase domain-containing protein [Gemmatimonadales bacterium]
MRASLCLFAAAGLVAALPARAQTPQSAPPARTELVRRLAHVLDSLSARDQFSGVVVLASQGATVFERAYGMADREAGHPNTLETAFNVGSINKIFTSIAIRQLAAAGTLDLDSTLARYWPDYPNREVARRVTIRQLLEHRSGIGGNIFDAPAGGKRSDIRRLRDYLPLFVHEPLQFEPGSGRRYSNAGYVVLGLLVERLSGEDYYDYVRRHIYEPAGMTRTAHWPVDSLPPNTAIGYTRQGGTAPLTPLRRNSPLLPGRGSSAGGGYSTAHDLVRFLEALRTGRIPAGPSGGFGIAGGAPGLNAVAEAGLPGGLDLVAMANLDPPAAQRIAQVLREWLAVKE